jgi:hypothetical protein
MIEQIKLYFSWETHVETSELLHGESSETTALNPVGHLYG